MDLTRLDLWSVLRMVKTGEISARTLVTECINKTEKYKDINAFTYLNKEKAVEDALQTDGRLYHNKHTGILCGIPVGIKDNFCTEGMPTSCASEMFRGNTFDLDATAVKKLKEQDAVILGKTNMDEFAMGTRNDTSAFGGVKNPLDPRRTPGGSSGGSAAAVAVGSVYAALGTDTGGSVRQPASYCGITGLKPTFGRISRHGVYPLAASLDHVGILTKTVKDSLLVFETVYGPDKFDKTTEIRENLNFDTHCLDYTNKRLRIAVMKQSFDPEVKKEVRQSVKEAADFFAREGYAVSEISFDMYRMVPVVYAVLCCGRVAKDFGALDGIKSGNGAADSTGSGAIEDIRGENFGIETKRRVIYGKYVTHGRNEIDIYEKAKRVRTLIINFFMDIFTKYDIVMTPTAACGATLFEEKDKCAVLDEYTDIFTIIGNLTGRPAISVPCGRDENGMPLGLQFMGKTFNEHDVFNIAYMFESNIGKEYITRI
mgnify:FL=1